MMLYIVAQAIGRVKSWIRAVRFRAVPEWLTAAEAAKYLRVDRTTIYRWEKAGIIHSYPLPIRGRRFKQADLDALLDPGGQKDGNTARTR